MNKKVNNKPLISIVIPVYNGENYIEECINSITNQDYKNIEIIIVNDGSKDNSKNIAEKLRRKDKRIIIIDQENAGVSTARNNGIATAKGEYITFIDVDDYISRDYISYYYKLLKENNAEIALTPFPRKFNEKTKKLEEQEISDYVEIWSGEETAAQMLYYNIVIAPWNKMISMKLINENGIKFNPKLSFGEGFNFSVDCFQRAKRVAVGHKKVYHYRVDNPNSVMTKLSLKLITGSIEAQKTIKENLVNKNKQMLDACKYANWHTYCDCYNTIVGSNKIKYFKKEYKMLKKVCRKDSICAISAPVPKKEKIKSIMYFISPYITAKIINHFRIRKFTVEEN